MAAAYPQFLPGFSLKDPRWITAIIAMASFASIIFLGVRDLDGWRQKTDRQIELLTYLACRNEATLHPGVPLLECERFWKRNAAGQIETIRP